MSFLCKFVFEYGAKAPLKLLNLYIMAKFAYLLRFGTGREFLEFVQVRTLVSLLCKYRLLRKSHFTHWSLSVLNIDTSESVIITHDVKHWSLYRFEHKVKSIKNFLTYGREQKSVD